MCGCEPRWVFVNLDGAFEFMHMDVALLHELKIIPRYMKSVPCNKQRSMLKEKMVLKKKTPNNYVLPLFSREQWPCYKKKKGAKTILTRENGAPD